MVQQRREDALKLEALRRAITLGRKDAAEGRTVRLEPNQVAGFLRNLGRTARA